MKSFGKPTHVAIRLRHEWGIRRRGVVPTLTRVTVGVPVRLPAPVPCADGHSGGRRRLVDWGRGDGPVLAALLG